MTGRVPRRDAPVRAGVSATSSWIYVAGIVVVGASAHASASRSRGDTADHIGAGHDRRSPSLGQFGDVVRRIVARLPAQGPRLAARATSASTVRRPRLRGRSPLGVARRDRARRSLILPLRRTSSTREPVGRRRPRTTPAAPSSRCSPSVRRLRRADLRGAALPGPAAAVPAAGDVAPACGGRRPALVFALAHPLLEPDARRRSRSSRRCSPWGSSRASSRCGSGDLSPSILLHIGFNLLDRRSLHSRADPADAARIASSHCSEHADIAGATTSREAVVSGRHGMPVCTGCAKTALDHDPHADRGPRDRVPPLLEVRSEHVAGRRRRPLHSTRCSSSLDVGALSRAPEPRRRQG